MFFSSKCNYQTYRFYKVHSAQRSAFNSKEPKHDYSNWSNLHEMLKTSSFHVFSPIRIIVGSLGFSFCCCAFVCTTHLAIFRHAVRILWCSPEDKAGVNDRKWVAKKHMPFLACPDPVKSVFTTSLHSGPFKGFQNPQRAMFGTRLAFSLPWLWFYNHCPSLWQHPDEQTMDVIT